MLVKTTKRYPYAPIIRYWGKKSSDNAKCWKAYEDTETLLLGVKQFIINLTETTEILLLSNSTTRNVCNRNACTGYQELCTRMFITVTFVSIHN